MINQSKFSEQNKEIIKFRDKTITSDYVMEWLDLNWNLYINSIDCNSCSHRQSPFPCFCCVKNSDCLFGNFYLELSVIQDYHKLNTLCQHLLDDFKEIENDVEKVSLWLKKHLDFGLNKLNLFNDFESPRKMRKSFINGRNYEKKEFDYITIYLSLEKFKYIYKFKKLFDELFFEEKILIKEYEIFIEEIKETELNL